MATETVIPCICLTCGVRNDFSHPNGYCQNNHDDWLEYSDVVNQNQFFKRAMRQTGWNSEELTTKFMNANIKQFKFIKT